MKFVCYKNFSQLPASANDLFLKSEKDSLFFSRLWFDNLVTTSLKNDQVIYLACVVCNNRVLALLPLMKRTEANWYSLTNHYSPLYTLLVVKNDQQKILSCLAQGLKQLPFKSLRLESIAEKDSSIDCLQRAMESSGFSCHRYLRFFNWSHQIHDQSFDDYMNARPARVRNTIKRKSRKLEREHGYNVRLFTSGDLKQALADYNAIYKASWKANESAADFIQGIAESTSNSGWLRLAILYIKDQPVAGQIWFVLHGKANIFRLAYDESWKKYSPGSILIKFMMEYVIETDKVVEIDFLTGNERYKQDWISECKQRWGLNCIKNIDSKSKVEQFVLSLKKFVSFQR